MTKYLFKANDDVLSFCECSDEPAMSTGQLDCPWCGCGWLISCSSCAKAFTFAEIRETDRSLEEIGRQVLTRQGFDEVSDSDVTDWAEYMAHMLTPFEVGDKVVYLDGGYFALDYSPVRFKGYYAEHDLERLPQALALKDRSALDVLEDPEYWRERRVESDDS